MFRALFAKLTLINDEIRKTNQRFQRTIRGFVVRAIPGGERHTVLIDNDLQSLALCLRENFHLQGMTDTADSVQQARRWKMMRKRLGKIGQLDSAAVREFISLCRRLWEIRAEIGNRKTRFLFRKTGKPHPRGDVVQGIAEMKCLPKQVGETIFQRIKLFPKHIYFAGTHSAQISDQRISKCFTVSPACAISS